MIEVDKTFGLISPEGFDSLVIPGGRSPAYLRRFPAAREFVARFAATGKPVAAICHGGQLIVAAGLVDDLTVTGYPRIREEMEAAGARFADRKVVVDGNVITSRVPEDLPAFNAAIKEMMLGGCLRRDDAYHPRLLRTFAWSGSPVVRFVCPPPLPPSRSSTVVKR